MYRYQQQPQSSLSPIRSAWDNLKKIHTVCDEYGVYDLVLLGTFVGMLIFAPVPWALKTMIVGVGISYVSTDVRRIQTIGQKLRTLQKQYVGRRKPAAEYSRYRHEHQRLDEMLDGALQSMDASLDNLVEEPVEAFLDIVHKLRDHLTSRNHIRFEQFAKYLTAALKNLKKGDRYIIGSGGLWGVGKSTYAGLLGTFLRRLEKPYTHRNFSFDDFLYEEGDRPEESRLNFFKIYKLGEIFWFLVAFVRQLPAATYMHDSLTGGELGFEVTSNGNIILYNGDVDSPRAVRGYRTVRFDLHDQERLTFDYTERMFHGPNKIEDLTVERAGYRGPSTNLYSLKFTCGSTPVSVVRESVDTTRITLRNAAFIFTKSGDNVYFKAEADPTPWEEVQPLVPGERIPALDWWLPVGKDEIQVVVAEGVPVFLYRYWNITCKFFASWPVRALRTMRRYEKRGRGDPNENSAKVLERHRLTDSMVNAASTGAEHTINGMTLAELIVEGIESGRLFLAAPRAAFMEHGMDVDELRALVEKATDEYLSMWLMATRGYRTMVDVPPFEPPGGRDGLSESSKKELFHQYFSGPLSVFLERDMLVQFQRLPNEKTAVGLPVFGFDPKTKEQLVRLLSRCGPYVVDAHLLDMGPHERNSPFPIARYTETGERIVDNATLRNVLITAIVPKLLGHIRGVKKDDGEGLFRKFFSTHRALWHRGFIDLYPNWMDHGVAVLDDGQSHVQCASPSNFLSDHPLRDMARIAKEQNKVPLNARYENISPLYAQLTGFQRQFLRTMDLQGNIIEKDLLARIPEPLKQFYIEMIFYNVPVDETDMEKGFRYNLFQEKESSSPLQNRGITTFRVEQARLEAVERYLMTELTIPGLFASFVKGLAGVQPNTGTPALAWCRHFLSGLKPHPTNSLYAIIQLLYEQLSLPVSFLDPFMPPVERGAQIKNIYNALRRSLQKTYYGRGEPEFSLREWEAQAFERFLDRLLDLPALWKDWDPHSATSSVRIVSRRAHRRAA